MTHRAETILAAVTTALTGLTTTGTNVFRGRAYPFQPGQVPGLAVFMGEETVAAVQSHDQLVVVLEVLIDAHVAQAAADIDTALNLIRAEVTVALAADYTLGLSFVEGAKEVGSDAPEIGEGDRPSAVQRIGWTVSYQRVRTDPSM